MKIYNIIVLIKYLEVKYSVIYVGKTRTVERGGDGVFSEH